MAINPKSFLRVVFPLAANLAMEPAGVAFDD
jgi:hypothetical protein